LQKATKEFEAGKTNEAKFAKAMDRFGGTSAEFNVPCRKVYDNKKTIKYRLTTIWNSQNT